LAEVGVALAFLLVIRPLAGWLGLTPGKTGPGERAVIAFFGVRGIGTLFYVAFAVAEGSFDGPQIWALAALVVALSIVLHGMAATPAMAALDRRRRREARTGDALDIATTPA
jgi:NhaP-type Na+/H+ or K+/H+ antiporter